MEGQELGLRVKGERFGGINLLVTTAMSCLVLSCPDEKVYLRLVFVTQEKAVVIIIPLPFFFRKIEGGGLECEGENEGWEGAGAGEE